MAIFLILYGFPVSKAGAIIDEKIKLLFDEKVPRLVIWVNSSQEVTLSYSKIFILNDINEIGLFYSELHKQSWKVSRVDTSHGFRIEYISNIDVNCLIPYNRVIKDWGTVRIVFYVENMVFEKGNKKIDGTRNIVIDIEIIPNKDMRMSKIVLLNEFWCGDKEYFFAHNGIRYRIGKGEMIRYEASSSHLYLQDSAGRFSYSWIVNSLVDGKESKVEIYYSLRSYPILFFVYDYGKIFHDPEITLPQSIFKSLERISEEVKKIENYLPYFIVGVAIGIILLYSGKLFTKER